MVRESAIIEFLVLCSLKIFGAPAVSMVVPRSFLFVFMYLSVQLVSKEIDCRVHALPFSVGM
jgi:hypothetical protein